MFSRQAVTLTSRCTLPQLIQVKKRVVDDIVARMTKLKVAVPW